MLCYSGIKKGLYGVGFLLNKKHKHLIKNFQGLSDRVAILQLAFHNQVLSLIQIYAPTNDAEEDEITAFYDTLRRAQTTAGKNCIIMGDFNAKIGAPTSNEYHIMGKFGTGERNNRGQLLIDYAKENNLSIMNTYYKMKSNSRWTWRSPDGKTLNEIDFMLTDTRKVFLNVEILHKVLFPSDHRLVRATISLHETKKSRVNFSKKLSQLNCEAEVESYRKHLIEYQNEVSLHECDTVQTYYNKLERYITRSLQASITSDERKPKTKSIITDSTKDLIARRYQLQNTKPKTPEIKKELSALYKMVSREIKSDYRKYRHSTIEKNLTERGSVKRAYRQLKMHKTWIPSLTEQTIELKDRTNILEAATAFYKQLYNDTVSDTYSCHSHTTNNQSISSATTEVTTEVDDWSDEEIIEEIKRLKLEKSPGPDNIPNAALKSAMDLLLHPIRNLFKLIKFSQTVPDQWAESHITLLYKKGNPKDISNYRPISLLNSLYKLFSSCLLNRISAQIDGEQPIEQAGFRSGFSTMDHIHTIEQIFEKYGEYKKPLYVAFIDYKKAFDTIFYNSIWEALEQNKIHSVYISIIKDIYNKSVSRVKLEKLGPLFQIKRGAKQGDPLSPKIFIAVLESVFRTLYWKNLGIRIGDKRLHHLRFADDVVLFTENCTDLQYMIQTLQAASRRVGLEINLDKTKLMTNSTPTSIYIDHVEIEYVEDFIYLGKQVSFKPQNTLDEIERRVTKTWSRYWSLREIFKSRLPLRLKKLAMDSCLLPCLTYGAQTWTHTNKTRNKLIVCQRAMERSLLSIRKIEKINSSVIREETKVIDFMTHALKLKWQWAGHIARLNDGRWTKTVTTWIGPKGKRKRGRPKYKWADDICGTAGRDWIKKAAQREPWKALEEAYTRKGFSSSSSY